MTRISDWPARERTPASASDRPSGRACGGCISVCCRDSFACTWSAAAAAAARGATYRVSTQYDRRLHRSSHDRKLAGVPEAAEAEDSIISETARGTEELLVYSTHLHSVSEMYSLFSPLGMLADRAICSACADFFLNDSFDVNYLRIYWTDFHEILPNCSRFIVVIDLTLFFQSV